MCGIFGIVVRQARVAPELLERATLSLSHRGPDDSGTILVRVTSPEPVEIGLGNRRLAILDLSQLGHQPMRDPETGNWIVFNGEIFNFRAIREKLQREGLTFLSDSDTEVLLKAYGRWQEGCLAQLRGIFAFAIWDAQRRRLFLARDPMGVKPLYYASTQPHFLFSSEVRSLLGTGLLRLKIDEAGLRTYLKFGSIYDPLSLLEGIQALLPGHYLIWEQGRVTIARYWDLTSESGRMPPEQVSPADRDRLVEEVCATLCESVRMQTVSDVPVGVFLSGGIDSSSLAGILSKGKSQISTFSIVFRESEYNEAEFSRMVAQRFATDHHEILVSQLDALEAIPSAMQAMDQPSIDGLNTYLISRQTRAAGIKVALSGLGGDEMFAGYSTFREVPRMESFSDSWRHLPGLVRAPAAAIYRWTTPASDQNRKLADLAAADPSLLHPYFLARALFTEAQCQALLARPNADADERARAQLRDTLQQARHLDSVNRVSYLEARCYMLNTLLRDADVMSMAHGLEVRVPLIDHRLAETLLALPGAWKLNESTPKPLLVGALQGALPDEIVHRRKRGFTLPFEHWLRDQMRSEVEQTLRAVKAGPLGAVLNSSAVERTWQDFLSGQTSWSRPWALYVLQRWCELHAVTA